MVASTIMTMTETSTAVWRLSLRLGTADVHSIFAAARVAGGGKSVYAIPRDSLRDEFLRVFLSLWYGYTYHLVL